MAHELHKDSQGYRMFYVKGSEREKISSQPWHSKETNPIAYDVPPTIEQVIQDLRADVEIRLRPVFNQDGNLIPSCQEIWRPHLNDQGEQIWIERHNQPGSRFPSGDSLDLVGPDYQIIQDHQVVEMFRPWLENNLATLETGGAIFNGKGFWILAKINREALEICKDDVIQTYFLIFNFHGGLSLVLKPTEIRVVCNNTLTAAHRASKNLFTVRHSGNIQMKLEEVQNLMESWNVIFDEDVDIYKQMADWKFKSAAQAKELYGLMLRQKDEDETEEQKVLSQDEEEREASKMERSRTLQKWMAAYVKDAKRLPNNRNSLWQWYNSITDDLTHTQGRSVDKRIAQMWARQNNGTKAFDLVKKVLKGQVKLTVPATVSVLENISHQQVKQ